jgi:hypothetical protein
MKSELLLQYLGYFAVAVFCGWFIITVLKVQGDFMINSVEGVESFVGGSVIEGMKVTENEKKRYETGTQHLDILMDTLDKDNMSAAREYIESVPQDTKDTMLELYDLFIESTAISLLTVQCKDMANIKDSKGANKFLNPFYQKFMGKLNENEDVRIKALELLGRKK